MGAFRTGSYEVTPPGRSRVCGTARQADRSRQGQQVRVSLTESQTQRAGPSTSSLSCVAGTARRRRTRPRRLVHDHVVTTQERHRPEQAVRDAPQLHDRVAAALVRAGLRLSHRERHQWAPASSGHGPSHRSDGRHETDDDDRGVGSRRGQAGWRIVSGPHQSSRPIPRPDLAAHDVRIRLVCHQAASAMRPKSPRLLERPGTAIVRSWLGRRR